ncbi:MAG TPA: sulfatase, partial [Paracoccaceae bacterium]|nr:sulfatase [Paracoccaceae bacterium]
REPRSLHKHFEFRAAAARDPLAGAEGLFARLEGRDILVVFVESYGRASFDNPLYAPTHRATLEGAEAALAAAGLAMSSGWLVSPIEGGQSWLAHGTFASGLRTGDQTRYGALLASSRRTLWQIGQAAGYHAVAVAPGVVFPWPEARRLGFETVLNAAALDYRGARFNWVTMPDQFVLGVWRDRLPASDPRPVIAQMALISSHAPWVPVPVPVAWEEVGDGSIFTPMTEGSDPPDVVWRDRDRVRDQYRQALDYSLRVTFDWAARQVGERAPLIIVMGDHPAAGFVSQIGSPDVPVHLLGPPEALEPFAPRGGAPGLSPGPASPRWPMEDFRDRFLQATQGPHGGDAS